jgi:hypothetical protein
MQQEVFFKVQFLLFTVFPWKLDKCKNSPPHMTEYVENTVFVLTYTFVLTFLLVSMKHIIKSWSNRLVLTYLFYLTDLF